MTREELDELPSGTTIYLITDWEAQPLIFDGRVKNRDYYTLTHPPDADGTFSNRKPVYLHALDLLNATLNEKEAWQKVKVGLIEHITYVVNKIESF